MLGAWQWAGRVSSNAGVWLRDVVEREFYRRLARARKRSRACFICCVRKTQHDFALQLAARAAVALEHVQRIGRHRDVHLIAFADVRPLIGAQLDHLPGDVEIDDRRVAKILDEVDARRD